MPLGVKSCQNFGIIDNHCSASSCFVCMSATGKMTNRSRVHAMARPLEITGKHIVPRCPQMTHSDLARPQIHHSATYGVQERPCSCCSQMFTERGKHFLQSQTLQQCHTLTDNIRGLLRAVRKRIITKMTLVDHLHHSGLPVQCSAV